MSRVLSDYRLSVILRAWMIIACLGSVCRADVWEEPFREAVSGCTRFVVRSGGTGRHFGNEKDLFEVTDRRQIAEWIDLFQFVDGEGDLGCFCDGDPTFEFYREEELLVMLGYHHAVSLSWPGGEWPLRAVLTDEATDAMTGRLAERGVTWPRKAMEANRRRQETMRRRMEMYRAMLPNRLVRTIEENDDPQVRFVRRIKRTFPDPVERVGVLLKLYGCDQMPWSDGTSFDMELGWEIAKSDDEVLWEAIDAVKESPEGMRGAARHVLSGFPSDFHTEQLERVLPSLVRIGLTHPRRSNRERTFEFLNELEFYEAQRLWHNCLDGKYEVLPLPEGAMQWEEDNSEARIREPDFAKACSERAYAALQLCRAGDVTVRAKILARMEDATDADRTCYEQALAILDGVERGVPRH